MCIYACAYIQYLREETRCLRQKKLQTETPVCDFRVRSIRVQWCVGTEQHADGIDPGFKCCAVVSQRTMMVEPGCYALAKVANRNTGSAFPAGNSTRESNAIVSQLISPSRALGTFSSYTTERVLGLQPGRIKRRDSSATLCLGRPSGTVQCSLSYQPDVEPIFFNCMPCFFPVSPGGDIIIIYASISHEVTGRTDQ